MVTAVGRKWREAAAGGWCRWARVPPELRAGPGQKIIILEPQPMKAQ